MLQAKWRAEGVVRHEERGRARDSAHVEGLEAVPLRETRLALGTLITIREARDSDTGDLLALRRELWPHHDAEEEALQLKATFAGRASSLPLALFVAAEGVHIVGFVEVGLRSHADGCDAMRPVGFVEGWYVKSDRRRRGIGGALLAKAEAWARELGCTEMGSDALADNELSQHAHEALGYSIVDRCVHYRKAL